MGCDIHACFEYTYADERLPRWYCYAADIDLDRWYQIFTAMAGVRNYNNIDVKYPPRGVPKDLNQKTKVLYERWDGDAHTPSWLTYEELNEVIGELVDINLSYGVLLAMMKSFHDAGRKTRLVFWFDN